MTAQPICTLTVAPPKERRIVLARVVGFCFGVQRAVELTEAARRERHGRLTTLGPIIHNDQVIAKMRRQGIDMASDLGSISEGAVVLSAHGVPPTVVRQAQEQGLNIVDVTCPFVTKVHRSAKQLYEQGYQVLLVGDPGHTEVRGVIGAVEAIGGKVTLVSTPEQVRTLNLGKKVGLVCQTTQRADHWAAIIAEVSRVATEVRAINTICNATDELQDAAIALARQVQIAIVIGGRNSANTRRLRQLCEGEGIPAYHIETVDEIDESWFEDAEVIGITAGASTPDWLIEQVARYINGGELPSDWNLRHPDEKTLPPI